VRFEQPPQGFATKASSVLWERARRNDDELRFSVYFRGEPETDWKLLKEKLEQKFYPGTAPQMPDGPIT